MTISLRFAVLVSFIGLAGCGNEAPPVTDATGPIPSSGGSAAPPSAPLARKEPKPQAMAPKRAPKTDSAMASANPRDVFAVANNEPNFAIVDDGPSTFLAAAPEAGVDSTQFEITPPKSSASGTSRPANRFKLPEGFAAVEGTDYSVDGYPQRIICEKDGAEMVLIPESISTQGTNDGPSNARPQIAVFLEPYYIDVAEVTVGQFAKFLDWFKENKDRNYERPVNADEAADLPALGVTWAGARNYTQWAGKQLPNEAEWEKAARGPEGFLHPWGNGRAGWSPARKRDQIDPVKSFRADISPYGVFDMAGNATEWCDDFYAPTAYEEAVRNGETVVRKWEGPKRGRVEGHRVVKGNGPDWMAWHRGSAHMRESGPTVGFRCVLRGFTKKQDDDSKAGGRPRPKAAF